MLLLWWNLVVAHTHTHVLTKNRLKERVENLNNSVPTHTHVVAKLGKERKREERNTTHTIVQKNGPCYCCVPKDLATCIIAFEKAHSQSLKRAHN